MFFPMSCTENGPAHRSRTGRQPTPCSLPPELPVPAEPRPAGMPRHPPQRAPLAPSWLDNPECACARPCVPPRPREPGGTAATERRPLAATPAPIGSGYLCACVLRRPGSCGRGQTLGVRGGSTWGNRFQHPGLSALFFLLLNVKPVYVVIVKSQSIQIT